MEMLPHVHQTSEQLHARMTELQASLDLPHGQKRRIHIDKMLACVAFELQQRELEKCEVIGETV